MRDEEALPMAAKRECCDDAEIEGWTFKSCVNTQEASTERKEKDIICNDSAWIEGEVGTYGTLFPLCASCRPLMMISPH